MNALHSLLSSVAIWALVAWGGPAARAAEEPSADSRPDYGSFRIITDRNIFNANRSGRTSRRPRETPRPSKVDTVTLLGTMSYEKGRFAFFDGSDSQYRATLEREGTIAGLKVVDIGANHVKLDADGKPFDLRVGAQLRREDGGEWNVAAREESPAGGLPRPVTASSDSAAGKPTGGEKTNDRSSSGMSDALKRLLEQREKEMQ